MQLKVFIYYKVSFFFVIVAISCDDPGELAHGYRKYDSFEYNGRVQYFCEEGYEISGRSMRICKENGQWSGSLPSCNGK